MTEFPMTKSWLNNFDVALFLSEYWQKKPLVIRQGFTAFADTISPDELAGLACESDIESRLIMQKQKSDEWQLRHGPFEEDDFAKLPKSHWTLLVQAVDLWSEEVAAMKQFFRFIPDWRMDDVMISFAAPYGSVGPHYDNYDVFLIQGQGSRTWRIGQYCGDDATLLPHPALRLLEHFETQEEYILEPGDILYVPPRVAHWGISNDESLTYSVGYRAPSSADILCNLADDIAQLLPDTQRYYDPEFNAKNHPAFIPANAIATVRALITEALSDNARIGDWFGRYMTETKYPALTATSENIPMPPKGKLVAIPVTRFAFTDSTLYANGRSYKRTNNDLWLTTLIDKREIDISTVKASGKDALTLLQQLLDDGVLDCDD